jgi:hypothetical protein
MEQYLIDNYVISNYFSGLFPEKAMDFIAEVIDLIPNISVITQIEALSWRNPDTRKEMIIRDFIENARRHYSSNSHSTPLLADNK